MQTSTNAIAQQLIAFLRTNDNIKAIEALYADDIYTEEAGSARTRSGKGVILQSMRDFLGAHDFHYTHIEGPLVSGDSFAVRLRFEATNRETGTSFAVDEIGVYTVREGKIAREQFLYAVA